ncbi:hypothetical protein [Stygiolobus caldivivus]|uniref:Uncharacterized protein n=1 Tax=Stygiolobus caldivivus TaxID=2824673 RepID=A0A8D5ZJ07_9CREN|nr:hypothetical protein [Stygiolobus caldivivus]BCU71069.1 hypothetical protein KN1_23660 [Stygiolobus caldivivus]
MQINKCIIKRDIQDQEIFSIINIEDGRRIEKINEIIKNKEKISGDLLRITDYISVDKETLEKIVSAIKDKYGIIGLKLSISIAFLTLGLGLEKREKYMKEVGEEWEKIKESIGLIPFEKYYDYEYRSYDINISTLKKLGEKSSIINLNKNDFIHLQVWIISVLLSGLKERGIKFRLIKEGTELTGIRIESRKKDIQDIFRTLESEYGKIVKLYSGWFIFND